MIKATYSDKSLIMEILCKSFDTNKSVSYIVKQDNKREGRIRKLMEYSFDLCHLFGEIYLSDDREACALTIFPDKKKTTVKSVLLDVKLVISCIGVKRVTKVLNRDSKIKSFYPKTPVFHIMLIGVDPRTQHKGVGTNLLKDIIQESNLLKRPIYLETSMPENLEFYNKMGFEVYKESDFDHKLFLLK